MTTNLSSRISNTQTLSNLVSLPGTRLAVFVSVTIAALTLSSVNSFASNSDEDLEMKTNYQLQANEVKPVEPPSSASTQAESICREEGIKIVLETDKPLENDTLSDKARLCLTQSNTAIALVLGAKVEIESRAERMPVVPRYFN